MEYKIISKNDSEYPSKLLKMKPYVDPVLGGNFDLPEKIFVTGKLPLEKLNSSTSISIIGSRSPFHTAYEIAELIGRIAASLNLIVISGYATGIDSAGHLGAMDGLGNTIAVLGSGINVRHPEKPALERYILENGLFISEQQDPNNPREYNNLMARDRITAGLSDAIFVVETDLDGGAVHTAKIGLDQGRKVYTINWDSNVKYNGKHLGGNTKMISDGIAEPIDILDAGEEFEDKIRKILIEL